MEQSSTLFKRLGRDRFRISCDSQIVNVRAGTKMEDQKPLFDGRIFQVVRKMLKDDDGTPHIREIVRHPGAAVILPLLNEDSVCLIRNYRIAVDRELWELPAGTLEAGEDPEETARRELAVKKPGIGPLHGIF